MLPFVGLSIVPNIFKRVVFPPPEDPKIQMNYPLYMLKFMPLNAATPYNPKIYVFYIFYSLIS